jgi:hypothetical protein
MVWPLFMVFGILVIFVYLILDVTLLGRHLVSIKSHEEYFENSESPPYINITGSVLVSPEDQVRVVTATKDTQQCRESCTYDDRCVGFVFDGLKPRCDLLYDITGFVRNKDGLYTTASGIKLRDFIGDKQPDRKYLRFEGHELPPDGQGKISTHQFVKDVHECKKKCLEKNSTSDEEKCIAFEYDFKTKACTLNNSIKGKPVSKAQTDSYVLIN